MQEIFNQTRQLWDQWGFLGEVLTLIALLFTALAALITARAAWRSAVASSRAADETRVATTAQIMSSLLDEYRSDEMSDAMTFLRHIAQGYDLEVQDKLLDLSQKRPGVYKKLNPNRRLVSHFFGKIYLLQQAGYIDDAFVRTVVGQGEVEFYLEVIEPLENALNHDYDASAFEYFAKLYGLARRVGE